MEIATCEHVCRTHRGQQSLVVSPTQRNKTLDVRGAAQEPAGLQVPLAPSGTHAPIAWRALRLRALPRFIHLAVPKKGCGGLALAHPSEHAAAAGV